MENASQQPTTADPGTRALIVTWQPDIDPLRRLVSTLLADGCHCHVIDNGSPAASAMQDALADLDADRKGKLELTCLPANTGLAAALNRGIEAAAQAGQRHLLLFDQDSAIDPGFCAAMDGAWSRAQTLSDRPLAALGPRVRDPDSGRPTPFRVFDRLLLRSDRPLAGREPFYRAGFLVTSGTLLSLDCVADIGPMRADYFIDNIDLEWCFRAAYHGYALVGTDRAVLHHRIGEASDRWLVRRGWLVEHGPERCYYSTRNRFHLHRQPHAPTGWVWRDRLRFLVKALWLMLFTARRGAYARSIRRGLRDAGSLL